MKKLIRFFSFILITVLSVSIFTGCGKNGNEKGRFVESNLNLPKALNGISELSVLENGDIALLGYVMTEVDESEVVMYTSSDKCETWTKKEFELPKAPTGKKMTISNASIMVDGGLKLIYTIAAIEDIEKLEQIMNGEKVEGQEAIEPEAIDALQSSMYELVTYDINSEGVITEIPVDKNVLREDGQIKFDKDGNIYFYDLKNSTITKINGKTGKVDIEFKLQSNDIQSFAISSTTFVALSSEEVIEFDLKSGKETNKIKLADELINNNGSIYPADDNENFFISSQVGVYEYKKGTKALKKVMDTSLTSLSDSDTYPDDMIQLSDEEYLVTYRQSLENSVLKLLKYEKEAQAKAENEITVYSLIESDEVKNYATRFKRANPDIHVNVVSGVTASEYSPVVANDAIKKLNTEIMAGKGPDIIFMDRLPMDSYISKGILEDISDLVINNDQLLPNVIQASKHTDGKVYTVPLEFSVPVIIAKDAEKINSLNSLASNIENIASETDKSIIDVFTAEGLAYFLYRLSGTTWVNSEGAIDTVKLTEYLTDVKTIYNATKDNVSEQGKKLYKDNEDYRNTLTQEEIWQYEVDGGNYIDLLNDKRARELVITPINSLEDLSTINSVVNSIEGYTYEFWKGQDTSSFFGVEFVAINAKSEKKEYAKKFIQYTLSKDEQLNVIYNRRLPVNKATVEEYLNSEESKYEYEAGGNYPDGTVINHKVKSLSYDEMNVFIGKFEELNSIANPDMNMINKVAMECGAYIRGEKSIDDTIKSIEDKLKIYLSE